ncbi:hypothetical protein C8F01DRAFT_768463 [Mycena amicta]|nr:hypothetical protein C8F01DRAFT_768463 [Mycena amicta]
MSRVAMRKMSGQGHSPRCQRLDPRLHALRAVPALTTHAPSIVVADHTHYRRLVGVVIDYHHFLVANAPPSSSTPSQHSCDAFAAWLPAFLSLVRSGCRPTVQTRIWREILISHGSGRGGRCGARSRTERASPSVGLPLCGSLLLSREKELFGGGGCR